MGVKTTKTILYYTSMLYNCYFSHVHNSLCNGQIFGMFFLGIHLTRKGVLEGPPSSHSKKSQLYCPCHHSGSCLDYGRLL